MAYLILRLFEGPINIVFWLPYSGHSVVVVAETLLEVGTQLSEYDSISSLLIDLRAKGLPCAPSESSKSIGVFVVCTIEA